MAMLRLAWVLMTSILLASCGCSKNPTSPPAPPGGTAPAPYLVLHEKEGAAPGDNLGHSVARVGDLDGDGRPDFMAGAPNANPNGLLNAGSAFVYSGATGTEKYRVDGTAAGGQLGYSVAGVDDVDGDARADFAAGAPFADPGGRSNAGSVFIFSGATGVEIRRLDGPVAGERFGWSIGSIPDVDADGRPDLVVGAPGPPGEHGFTGSVYLFSGATGQLVCLATHPFEGNNLGFSVAGMADRTADGKPDFVAGAPSFRYSGIGEAWVGSGSDCAIQRLVRAGFDETGYAVGSMADLNADGVPEIIIGTPYGGIGGTDWGVVRGYSGASLSLLFSVIGSDSTRNLGTSVSGSGDVDGDGRPDFIAGAPGSFHGNRFGSGSAYVHSGAADTLILRIDGAAAGDQLGRSAAAIGDVNGDGRVDFLVGAPGADPGGRSDAGAVIVFSRRL